MSGEILQAALQGGEVGGGQLIERGTAVHFQGAHGGHDDDGFGAEAALTAFDAEEFFTAEVEGETAFGDHEIGVGQGHAGGKHGVAAVGDVGEGAAVQESGHAFERLHEVGQEGVLEQGHQGAGDAEFAGEDGVATGGEADDNAVEALSQIVIRFGQAENGHDFGGGGDVEAAGVLGGGAFGDSDAAEGAVVDVEHAFPQHLVGGEAGAVKVEVVVDGGGEQVVGAGDGMEIASEVEIDGLSWENDAAAATCGPAFAAEHGAHGGLAEGERG